MLITPDFSQTQDQVSPGIYSCRVTDSKLDSWEGKDGKPATRFINWTLETFNEADSKNNGRKVFHRTPIEGKGAFRLQQFWKAATGEELSGEFDPTMVYGKEVEITVAEQKDKPEYTEIKSVRPVASH